MLNDIINDSKFSNDMKDIYEYIGDRTKAFDDVFDAIYSDMNNIYPNTAINTDDGSITIELSDASTCESVIDQIETAIKNKMNELKLTVNPLLVYKVASLNGNIIKIMKRI